MDEKRQERLPPSIQDLITIFYYLDIAYLSNQFESFLPNNLKYQVVLRLTKMFEATKRIRLCFEIR